MVEIEERAQRWGVIPAYEDFRGEIRQARPDVVEHVLEAMGAGDRAEPTLASTVVMRRGRARPAPGAKAIELEDGSSLDLDGQLPPDLPLGYHELVGSGGERTAVIVSPGTCFLPQDLHAWGWGVQLYSLRSGQSWGIGDLGDLARFGRHARGAWAGVALLNPLSAVDPTEPQNPSPYFPSSRRFENPLYLRIEDVPGADDIEELTELRRRGRDLNELDTIDRDGAFAAKMRALELIWERDRGDDPRLGAFIQENGRTLVDFATFMALVEHHGSGSGGWPSEYRDPSTDAVAAFRREHDDRVRFHMWVQWLIDEQLGRAAREIDLIHDLPVGIDGDGVDAWMWQDVFASGMSIGAPPDEFNTHGQDWGLPPFDPWELGARGYAPFIETIRTAFRHGAGIRIDHVMAMFRLFWVPDGVEPVDGVYVRYPHEALLNIVALESQRARAFVIGEDLGTVEGRVRYEMAARQMLSYKLMWFEEEPPEGFPPDCLAAITNHDSPTIAGLWTGSDLDEQLALELDPDVAATQRLRAKLEELLGVTAGAPVSDVIARAHQELAKAPSRIVIATLEDALGVTRRPNMPGTVDERPNWSIPLPQTLDEIERDPAVAAVASTLTEGRARSRTG